MNFKPELVEKILAGQKTQTRRAMSENPRSPWYCGACKLRPNRAYALCPGRGKHQVGKIAVLDVRDVRLGDIDTPDARAEGFEGVNDFVAYWISLHGRFDPDQRLWAITFSLIPPEDYALWEAARSSHEGSGS